MPRILNSYSAYSFLKKKYTSLMRKSGVSDAEISFREIVAKVVGQSNVSNFAQRTISRERLMDINRKCLERMERKPLQYVIGEWDFRHLTLHMKEPVFIPRPETEALVQLALDAIASRKQSDQSIHKCPQVLEVGCGSGAVSLSLLHECPLLECTAVDRSEAACKLTLGNAALCGLTSRLHVFNCSVTEQGRLDHPQLEHSSYDLIVSNPPYITTREMEDLQPEITRYEDEYTLWGGDDGLDVVRWLLHLCRSPALTPGGTLLLEVGLEHPPILKQMLSDHRTWAPLSFQVAHKDFTNRERFVEVFKKN